MNRKAITTLVADAIAQLIHSERKLLERNVSERALTHHLARFIREGVARLEGVPATFDVDVEYNRMLDDPKRLQLPSRTALDDELRAAAVFPDIIVHVRGTHEHNLLVLEVKKPGEDLEYDKLKLRAFRKELHYQHAAHIILGWDGDEIVSQISWVDE